MSLVSGHSKVLRRLGCPQSRWALITLAIMLGVGLVLSPTAASAQGQRQFQSVAKPESMSVQRSHVLVSSFMGFGVQLDPYAYPPGKEQWKRIESRLDRMHPAFLRVMFPSKDYCLGLSASGCTEYVWQQKGKRLPEQFEEILRILDYAQSHHTPVMIGEWSWPRLPHAADVAPITGPGDPRWAAIIAPFLVYLRQDRGHADGWNCNHVHLIYPPVGLTRVVT